MVITYRLPYPQILENAMGRGKRTVTIMAF